MASHVAAALAERIGLEAVHAEQPAYDRDKALHAACRYGRWLPVMALKLGPGERLEPGTAGDRPIP